MKLFSRKERIPTEDVKGPPPQRGAKRFFFLLNTSFGKLITANLLFVLFSLPVLTIPGSLTALNKVCVKLAREGQCYVWDEFWGEFKASVFRSLPLGLGCALCVFSAVYSIALGSANGGTAAGTAFMAVGMMLLLFALPMFTIAFFLLAMVELPLGAIIKDALALEFASLWRTVVILAAVALSAGILLLLFPISIFIHGLILFALTQLLLCLIILPLVLKYIVEPYQLAQSAQAGEDVQREQA